MPGQSRAEVNSDRLDSRYRGPKATPLKHTQAHSHTTWLSCCQMKKCNAVHEHFTHRAGPEQHLGPEAK